MKNTFIKLTMGIATMGFSFAAQAQCPAISCPTNISVNNDAGLCGAVVNYTVPVGTDPCYTGTGSITYNYTGAPDSLIIPAGVTSIHFEAYGASGGEGPFNNYTTGGLGGLVVGDLPVTAGQVLKIFVGQLGQNSSGNNPGVTGPYNGGGAGGSSIGTTGQPGGAAGGGASDIRIGGVSLGDRVVVAGGGGGAGGGCGSCNASGGDGGGLSGANGISYASGVGFEALGGSQLAGGASGSYAYASKCGGTDGSLGIGGDGWGCGYSGGGGGGAGYYGGGGGSTHYESGGGGGSSYTDATASNVIHTQGNNMGNGKIIISWTGGSPSTSLIAGLGDGGTFPIGTTTETYKVTGIYGDTATCSFTITVTNGIDITTNLMAHTITSNEIGATYQWLDCDNNNAIIAGATNQSYSPLSDGNFAVEITNGCVDTSACVSVVGVGINELSQTKVSIYPNPTNNTVIVNLGAHIGAISYTLITIDGKIIKQGSNASDNEFTIDLITEDKGIYFLKVKDKNESKVYKIIKQ